jgi:hypothetical protein
MRSTGRPLAYDITAAILRACGPVKSMNPPLECSEMTQSKPWRR